jgi:hypothetical protein
LAYQLKEYILDERATRVGNHIHFEHVFPTQIFDRPVREMPHHTLLIDLDQLFVRLDGRPEGAQ